MARHSAETERMPEVRAEAGGERWDCELAIPGDRDPLAWYAQAGDLKWREMIGHVPSGCFHGWVIGAQGREGREEGRERVGGGKRRKERERESRSSVDQEHKWDGVSCGPIGSIR